MYIKCILRCPSGMLSSTNQPLIETLGDVPWVSGREGFAAVRKSA